MVKKNYIAKSGNAVTMLGYSENLLRYVNSTVAEFDVCQNTYHNLLAKGKQFCVNYGQYYITNSYAGGISFLVVFFKTNYNNLLNSLGPVVLKDRLLGIVSYNFNGHPEVCSLIDGHRKFIENPEVSIFVLNFYIIIYSFNRTISLIKCYQDFIAKYQRNLHENW